MPKKQTETAPEETLDPAAAEKAFDAARPRLVAYSAEKLATLSVDLEKAAIYAAGVGRWVKTGEARKRFASMPKEYFDMAHVDNLETSALASYHAVLSLRSAAAGKSEAKLPVELVQRAMQIKQRMMKLLEYNVGEEEAAGRELRDIRLGTGYADLASDLLRLAKMYKNRRAEVKLDRKYVASDEADAGRTAHEILRGLGEERSSDQKAWTDLMLRSWTALDEDYGEVSGAGLWLWRHEDGPARFQSLYVVGRSAPKRAKGEKGGEGGGSEGGGGEGGQEGGTGG